MSIRTLIIGFLLGMSLPVFPQSNHAVQMAIPGQTLEDVFFTSRDVGFTVGRGSGGYSTTVNRTLDGGLHWTTDTVQNASLTSISFPTRDTGYIAGIRFRFSGPQGGTVTSYMWLKTVDGGNTWVTIEHDSLFAAVGAKCVFTTGQRGYIQDRGSCPDSAGKACNRLLTTINGGLDWQVHYLPADSLGCGDISFPDPDTGYVACGGGVLLKSVDKGEHWVSLQAGSAQAHLANVDFVDGAHGFVLTGDSAFLSTGDGGKTWRREAHFMDGRPTNMHFSDSKHGYVGGSGGDRQGVVMKTDDGGTTWVRAFLGVKDSRLAAVFTPAPDLCYAVGYAPVEAPDIGMQGEFITLKADDTGIRKLFAETRFRLEAGRRFDAAGRNLDILPMWSPVFKTR